MGTRADFYIAKNKKSSFKWLGSIAFNGYEIDDVANAVTKRQYLSKLKKFLSERDDATLPDAGWPWPWNNSKLTDECYVYLEDKNKIYMMYSYEGQYEDENTVANFCPIKGRPFDKNGSLRNRIPGKVQMFVPDMKAIKNVSFGRNSGLIVMSGR